VAIHGLGIHRDRAFWELNLYQQGRCVWLIVEEIDEAATAIKVVDEDRCLAFADVASRKWTGDSWVPSSRPIAFMFEWIAHQTSGLNGLSNPNTPFYRPQHGAARRHPLRQGRRF
jgi:hypothetical protein